MLPAVCQLHCIMVTAGQCSGSRHDLPSCRSAHTSIFTRQGEVCQPALTKCMLCSLSWRELSGPLLQIIPVILAHLRIIPVILAHLNCRSHSCGRRVSRGCCCRLCRCGCGACWTGWWNSLNRSSSLGMGAGGQLASVAKTEHEQGVEEA